MKNSATKILSIFTILLMVSSCLFLMFDSEESDAGYTTSTVCQPTVSDSGGSGSVYAQNYSVSGTDTGATIYITVRDDGSYPSSHYISMRVENYSGRNVEVTFLSVDDHPESGCGWYNADGDAIQSGDTYWFSNSDPIIFKGTSQTTVQFRISYEMETRYDTTAKISFDANGGKGAPNPVIKTLDNERYTSGNTTITLPSTAPVCDGMTFFGWNTSKDGTGTTYQPGETVTIGKTVETTYYAVWVGTPSPESTFIVTDVESLIYYSAFPDITVIVGNTGLTPNQLVLTENLHIADGTIIRMLDEELNSAGINPNGSPSSRMGPENHGSRYSPRETHHPSTSCTWTGSTP